MRVEFDAIPITAGVQQSKQGKSYYNITLEQDGEVVTVNTNDTVFGAIANLKYKFCHCIGRYVRSEFQGRVSTYFFVDSVSVQK